MTVLVFGKNGQVARELRRLLPDAVFLGRDAADLTKPQISAELIRAHNPSCVLNAAAYTNVDKAEAEFDMAATINGTAPAIMAEAAQKLGIPFVHISTDYVFDGSGSAPRRSDDPVGPICAYGQTKLQGEIGVRAAHETAVILRTSWVFSAHGTNFVKSMLRLGPSNENIRIVADQIGGPTPAKDIAAAVFAIASSQINERKPGATYHFSGAPDVSWADFAREVFSQKGLPTKVVDITTSEFVRPAKRPLNSRLNCESLARDYNIGRPDWRMGLAEVLAELAT
ncbi:MAG: dTDP-4-dehydrorhamnose reductase [Silicimonas sp.]|nr:dTDP-4-dehydrorhamnose reductase [Silicimonas sp.]